MSLATVDIYCTTSLPSASFACDGRQFNSQSPAATNPLWSKVFTSQLTTHVRHVVERIVVAREHRQKDDGRWLVRRRNARHRPMNERRNQTGGGVLNRLQPVHQSFRDTYRRWMDGWLEFNGILSTQVAAISCLRKFKVY